MTTTEFPTARPGQVWTDPANGDRFTIIAAGPACIVADGPQGVEEFHPVVLRSCVLEEDAS